MRCVNPNTGKPMTDWTVERKQADDVEVMKGRMGKRCDAD
jgi:hypothetical protein